ncbi:threonine dehydratase [Novispirillum sp. DQ9]|uniref:threonine dehydratase n=1 Tax=Novispirillum sp. DQ9 TaxID=3398612 RepID=UPI003C7C276B
MSAVCGGPALADTLLPDRAALEAAAALIARHMAPTPQIVWPLLSRRAGCEVVVKHENHTPIGAFKVRGGLVYLTHLREQQPCVRGVITATRGNHGQSVARAARALGLACVIVVPEGNNAEKNAAMEAFGAELIVHGHDFQVAAEHAHALSATRGLHFIPSFHPWLVAGVGTYALELFTAHADLDAVFVPIGMGSGISGLIAAKTALGLSTRIIGVVAEGADAYRRSFLEGRVVPTERADTIADGMACRSPDARALEIILDGAANIVTVSDAQVKEAMAAYVTDTHNLAEGAGAAPLAALLADRDAWAGRKVGLVLSGGNADRALIREVLA